MHDNRVIPRPRKIAYDLRRKVLLKNFLKEQMIHSALIKPPLEQSDSSESAGNPESDVNLTTKEEQVNAVSSTSELQSPSTSSSPTEKENGGEIENDSAEKCDKASTTSGIEKSIFPAFSKLKNALKMPSKTSRIVKAKRNLRAFKGSSKPFRRQPERSRNDNGSPSGRKRSLFSMFKSKKESKRRRTSSFRNFFSPWNSSRDYRSTSTSTAVQTDLEWAESTLDTMHQSNQCLREENRLLSESLNNIMSGINFTLGQCGKNPSIYSDHPYAREKLRDRELAATFSYAHPMNSNIPHHRVLRSKSIHGRSEYRERVLPMRSRSLNRARPYPMHRFEDNHLPPPPSDAYFDSQHFPNLRSNRYRSTDNRVLQSLPVTANNRPLLRRSSMPERPSNRTERIRLRSNSIREDSRSSYRSSERTAYRLANYASRPRNRESNRYSQPVPFQDLPPEAFY